MKKTVVFTFLSIIFLALIIKISSSDNESNDEFEIITPFVSEEGICRDSDSDIINTILKEDDVSTKNNTFPKNEFIVEEDLYRTELPKMLEKRPEQLMKRVGYITSYNDKTKNANWVAWKLIREHIDGPFSRKGVPYYEDMEVKGGRQELSDWSNTCIPIDHGHLCPAGDNKWSRNAMHQSFLLSNMSPQNHDLNNGDWKYLEERCRKWADEYGELYIATGPIFYAEDYTTIGNNKVGVPDAFFKVVLRLGKDPQALGFIYKNNSESHTLDYYLLSVDAVEQETGIDFFYNLPDDIEDVVESNSNLKKW